MNLNVPPHAVRGTDTHPRRSAAHRRDGERRARACSISAAATARCCASSPSKRGVDGRGIELSQAGVNSCVAQGLSVIQGDADTDLVYYPDLAFDYAILSQTIQATYYPAPRARAALAHRQARRGVLPQFRPLARAHPAPVRRQDAQDRQSSRPLVRHAEHPSLHHQGLRGSVRRCRRQDRARRGAQRLGHQARACPCRSSRRTCSASRRCFCCRGRARPRCLRDVAPCAALAQP